ncbi:hypothetical protein [Saprospira grandis]|uniref:hypothetical protein n=1 Tax=Saprospira grandis TaxID=1008 RepID=UPI0022DD5E5A|nr:hypothetical protein [Saprospira grandis]WBM73910.1 hypothetical protein OP864_13035 [Saprospira grandis]
MSKRIFYQIGVASLSLCSFSALYFLNFKANPSERELMQEGKRIIIRDPQTNKQRVIIIAPPHQRLDSSSGRMLPREEANGRLPDVEFLKLMLKKGKDGTPVL